MFRPVVLSIGVIAVGILAATGSLNAQSDMAAVVKERQDLMKTMGRSFGPLVAILKGESTDMQAAAAAATAMNEAIVKAATLFPEGTAKGDVAESRAKPEIWTQMGEFEAAAKALAEETAKLASAAESGDVDAFKAQFQATAQACGGCHEAKGGEGGKFRFPRES